MRTPCAAGAPRCSFAGGSFRQRPRVRPAFIAAALEFLRVRRILEWLALPLARSRLRPDSRNALLGELVHSVRTTLWRSAPRPRSRTSSRCASRWPRTSSTPTRPPNTTQSAVTTGLEEKARVWRFGVALTPKAAARHFFFGEPGRLEAVSERLLGAAVLAPLCYDGYSP